MPILRGASFAAHHGARLADLRGVVPREGRALKGKSYLKVFEVVGLFFGICLRVLYGFYEGVLVQILRLFWVLWWVWYQRETQIDGQFIPSFSTGFSHIQTHARSARSSFFNTTAMGKVQLTPRHLQDISCFMKNKLKACHRNLTLASTKLYSLSEIRS